LTQADLDKITFVNCGEGTEAVFDEEDSPTKIVVNFVVPACVGTSPVKVWSGKTLDEIAYGCTFTARFAGVSNEDTYYVPNSSIGYYEKVLCNDSGSVTNIIVEFQRQRNENVRCVVVSFDNGEDGIYATGLGARWIKQGTVGNYEFYRADGWHGNEIDLAATPTANYYTVFDLRVWPTIIVQAGETLFIDGDNYAPSIINHGTIVKTGEGTASIPFDNSSTGVTIVSNGTLKIASKTGSGTGHTIRVADGATFYMNGTPLTLNVILEEGARFVNTGTGLS
jgi:hypothetical protein